MRDDNGNKLVRTNVKTDRGIADEGSSAPAKRARLSTSFFFLVAGLGLAVWVARIPSVKDQAGLTDSSLGLALLAGPAGLILATSFAGRLVDRYGSAKTTWLSGTAYFLTLMTPGFAHDGPELMGALFAFGLAGGLLDVAMNAQAVIVERIYDRPLMAMFHANFSVGSLGGAALGGLCAWAGLAPELTFVVISLPLMAVALALGMWLIHEDRNRPDSAPADGDSKGVPQRGQEGDPAPAQGGKGYLADQRRLIVVLGVLALCCLIAEGSAGDWSGVYMRQDIGTSNGFAVAAFFAFSITMTLGRLLGDRITERIGAVNIVRGGGILAAVGQLAGLASDSAAGTIIGFGLLGAGLSCIVPRVFGAAGNLDAGRAGSSLARVAGLGYVGLVGGPPLIGGIAGVIGLRWALCVPALLAILIALGANAVNGRANERSA